ncbi:MAG: hypothetical protein ACTSR6_04985 [Candidatus Heimdallarchaeota archaeon]
MNNETKENLESEIDVSKEPTSRLSREYGTLKPEPRDEGGTSKLIDNAYIIAIIGAITTIIPAIGIPINLIAIICGAIAMKRNPHDRAPKIAVIFGSIFFVASAGLLIGVLVMVWDL